MKLRGVKGFLKGLSHPATEVEFAHLENRKLYLKTTNYFYKLCGMIQD